jgi:hypothetical protein
VGIRKIIVAQGIGDAVLDDRGGLMKLAALQFLTMASAFSWLIDAFIRGVAFCIR